VRQRAGVEVADGLIGRLMEATVGMYGDLQGIAGKSLQEIEGLDMEAIAIGRDTLIALEKS